MKKRMQYSEKKFLSFSLEKRNRILADYIHEIVGIWNIVDERVRLMQLFRECLLLTANRSEEEPYSLIASSLSGIESVNEFSTLTGAFFNKYGKSLADKDLLIGSNSTPLRDQKIPLIVVLDNLRSAFNVGSIIRTSECFGVEKLFLCGCTPTPENPKVLKTAMGTDKNIAWETCGDIVSLLLELKKVSTLIALETGDNSKQIYEVAVPKAATLVVGNEAFGINKKVISLADMVVKIPMLGVKESYNVGVAFGIGCYEIYRQWYS